jgi:hypothetical protein
MGLIVDQGPIPTGRTMSSKPKWKLEAEERDRRVERWYQDFLKRGVTQSMIKPVFVPAEDIYSNAEITCPICGRPTLFGMTRHVHVCEQCDWYYFAPQRTD